MILDRSSQGPQAAARIEPAHGSGRNIMFLVTEDWFFVSHFLELARHLHAGGWNVHVACSVNSHRRLIENSGVSVHPVCYSRQSLSPSNVLKTAALLRKVILSLAPDIVCAVALRAILLAPLSLIGLSRLPCLNLLTGMGSLYSSSNRSFSLRLTRSIVDRWLCLAARRNLSHLTVQNTNDLDFVRRRFRLCDDSCSLIPGSGISTGWTPQPEPKGTFRMVYVGRLLRNKGAADLVEACRLLVAGGLSVSADIIGDVDPSNPESYRPAEIALWEKTPGVTLKGWRSDVLEQISAAHLLVHPSYYGEGLPKILLEAGVCQRAVITCNTVGCREAVRDGENGLLVPPHNPQALANAIERLARDAALRHRLALCNRERVLNEFADEIILPRYADLIERMADRI
jgi:glycosyltransferase involved in cell wall biosynthesis